MQLPQPPRYLALFSCQVVPCLALLMEMTGWALTWDPTRPPPYRPLAEHLIRAAGARAAATAASLRPAHETLSSDVVAVAVAAEQQAADLERDLALQVGRLLVLALTSGSPMSPLGIMITNSLLAKPSAHTLIPTRAHPFQAAVPGLRGLAATAARRRYDVLSDCLETLFMYRPGSTGAASAALLQLEERVTALHVLLLRCEPRGGVGDLARMSWGGGGL